MQGLSQLLSFVITVLISVTALSVFIFGINPTLQKVQEESYVNQAFSNLKSLAVRLEDVATEGIGSSRQMTIDVPAGMYLINNETDRIEYTIITSESVLPNGTDITRDGIRFVSKQVAGRREVEIKLYYSNARINITNSERLPVGTYRLCIKKVGELSGSALIEVKSC